MSFLTTTFTLNTTTQLKVTHPPTPQPSTSKLVQTALSLLHDHLAYIRLNPLVVAVAAVPAQDSTLDVPALLQSFQSDQDSGPGSSPSSNDDGKDWTHYAITDRLPLPLGIPATREMGYAVALRDREDGMDSLVLAPGGVTILGRVVVEVREGEVDAGGEETIWLREEARVRCWWGLGWYIRRTMGRSHEELHEGFRERWKRRVRGG